MAAADREVVAPASATARTPILRARGVRVRHDDAESFTPDGASLDVTPGEVVLILGPSGCGKSTLALTFDGLIPHTLPAEVEGAVEVDGVPTAATTVAALSEHVAVVFQDPDAQVVTGSVLDEVAFGPENLRLPVAEVLARAEAALRRVGLWDRREENPDHLSGGGRQRLAIACALAMGAPLLVLDEPTANLDPEGVDDVYAALRDLVAAGDRAIVLVEHNLDAAMSLVDRVVVLDAAGRTIADGPVATVLRERADELHALGVWLPTATLAGIRLRDAGYAVEPLPLTPAELHAVLERAPRPPALPSPSPAPPPMPRAPAVEVRALTVRRRGRIVLDDIELTVPTGTFLAIVGRNGAGKSTLAQSIAGVSRPPRGAVRVGGLDPRRASAREISRRVGFVFQNPEHQFVTARVFDEIAHGLRLQRLPATEVDRRTRETLDRFALTPHADRHPFLLSGGQKRRLSVGTALVGGADVLVLDEPTFGQDRARADEMMRMLSDLHRAGTTIIIVSHDMQLVAEYAERVAVLDDGRLVAEGATDAVLGDAALLERSGLRPPPLSRAFAPLPMHPELDGAVRLADLPAAP